MLSVVTEEAGDVVYIHADLEGIEALESHLAALKASLRLGSCEHHHLFSEAWGGGELCESMLGQERSSGCRQVHHVKIYGWTKEWRQKHAL